MGVARSQGARRHGGTGKGEEIQIRGSTESKSKEVCCGARMREVIQDGARRESRRKGDCSGLRMGKVVQNGIGTVSRSSGTEKGGGVQDAQMAGPNWLFLVATK